jgi:glycerophosphoryl diester phosphodiesterase
MAAARTVLPKIFDLQGHRGARALWPENTARGIVAAAATGVTSIEIDVVLAADGVPVLFHDLSLNPDIVRALDGQWVRPGIVIAGLTADTLATYDVGRLRPGSRTAARFRRQHAVDGAAIPRLTTICALARAIPIRLDIEVKIDPAHASLAAFDVFARAILAAIGSRCDTMGGGIGFSIRSFDWRFLRHIRALCPTLPIAWLTADGANAEPGAVADEAGQGGWPAWTPVWAPSADTLRRRQIDAAHDAGLAVKPWTVNAPSRMRQLIGWGVDGFCTDRPDLALAALAGA